MQLKIIKNDLFDYKNRYIYQYENGFKFSLDSILLAEFVDKINEGEQVIDLCTGNAPIPLILTTKYNASITGVEYQEKIYNLAAMSIKENKLENKINVIHDDAKNINKYFKKDMVDKIICNPPYFKVNNSSLINDNEMLAIARHEKYITLKDIFILSSKLLKNNKPLYLVHRADRLDEIIKLGIDYNLRVKKIIVVQTKNEEIQTILIKCSKNAKCGMKIKIKDVRNLDSYQNIFEE